MITRRESVLGLGALALSDRDGHTPFTPLARRALAERLQSGSEPFPGRQSAWGGGQRYDFTCDGRPAVVVAPAAAADPDRPWLWRAEFFGAFPSVDQALLARGWHVAYLDCRNTFGSPETMGHWEVFYRQLVDRHRLHRRPVLLGMSRGGLYAYNWAAAHPDKVGLIYGDAPVCDVRSWPGGKGKGKGSPRDWALFQQVYGLTEAQALSWRGNPIDRLAPIARARIPILHLVGDADDVVPMAENTAVLERRYRQLGGRIDVMVKKGVGHHPHALPNPGPVVEFILKHRLRG
jgi:pimeloyl-ACP methyl ester carboxylesterase